MRRLKKQGIERLVSLTDSSQGILPGCFVVSTPYIIGPVSRLKICISFTVEDLYTFCSAGRLALSRTSCLLLIASRRLPAENSTLGRQQGCIRTGQFPETPLRVPLTTPYLEGLHDLFVECVRLIWASICQQQPSQLCLFLWPVSYDRSQYARRWNPPPAEGSPVVLRVHCTIKTRQFATL